MAFVVANTTDVNVTPSSPAGFNNLTDAFVVGSGFEVVWDVEPAASLTHTTYYRIFDASGAPITDPIAAGSYESAAAVPPHLQGTLALSDGTTLKTELISPSFKVVQDAVQLFDQSGAPLGDPIVIGGGGPQGLLQLPDGDVVVVQQTVTPTTTLDITATLLHNAASGGGTAPVAIDFFPANGSNSLPPDWNLGITFNEAVKAGAGTITLETAAGQVVQTFATASDPGIQFAGSSVVINPAADLQPGTTYKLVVAPDAVLDLAGNAYAGESGYTFTTAGAAPVPVDTTAPTAIDFFPANGSNSLPPDWNLGITFSEAVKAGSGTITLETAAGQVVQTFATASDPGIQFIGSSVVINPAADLQPGTTYKLVVAPDAVQDLAGNAYAGESGYQFTAALVGVPA